jgi:hypothetical protein
MNLRSTLAGAAAVVSCLSMGAAGTASASVIDWTLWSPSSVTTGSAMTPSPGSASGTAGSIDVGYKGEIESLSIDYPSYNPPSTFSGGPISNPPPAAGNTIQLFGGANGPSNNYGLTDTITFSKAVVDPVMAIWSLGQTNIDAQFDFINAPFSLVSGGSAVEYPGSSITVCGGNVCGIEGNGTIQFIGTYSSISFTTPVFEDWYGFTVGVVATPLPATWTMLIAGLAALGFAAYRGSKKTVALAAA